MDPLQFLICHEPQLRLDTPNIFLSSYKSFSSQKSQDIFLSLISRKTGETFLQQYRETQESLLSIFYDDHITVFHPKIRQQVEKIALYTGYIPSSDIMSSKDYHISRKEFISRLSYLSVNTSWQLIIPKNLLRQSYTTTDAMIQNYGWFLEIRDWVSFDKYIDNLDPDKMAAIYATIC